MPAVCSHRSQLPRTIAWTAILAVLITAACFTYWQQAGEDGNSGSGLLTRNGIAAADPTALRGQEMVQRFQNAVEHVERLRAFGKHRLFTLTQCPEDLAIGFRPENQQAPTYCGNTCEPWMARFAVVLLDQLLDASMRTLEWGSGSSSQWTLMRVGHLTSIEHDAQWSGPVREGLAKLFPPEFLKGRWDSHVVEAGPPVKANAPAYLDPDRFGNYSAAEFLPEKQGHFDYIAVDGRSRVACVKRALPLLRAEGGILLLDNSDRPYYAEVFELVPSHWLRFDDRIVSNERTTIWVSCRKGACGEASSGAPSDQQQTQPAGSVAAADAG